MLAFIKKVLGFGPEVTEAAPYKVEAPAVVDPQITDAVTQAPAKNPRAKKAPAARKSLAKTRTARKPKAQ